MTQEHLNLLKPILKSHQKVHKDMYISCKDSIIEIRVGAESGYKKEVLRAKIVKEPGIEKSHTCYDFKVVYFNNRITIIDAYWAMSVLSEILLDLTSALNKTYRGQNENI